MKCKCHCQMAYTEVTSRGNWNMMMSSNGNIFPVTGHLCGEFTGQRWIPRTKASDAELWCFIWSDVWINSWVNNREAGDLRRYRVHYDVITMKPPPPLWLIWWHDDSSFYLHMLMENRARISYYAHSFMWDAIIHRGVKINGAKLGYGWVIISHSLCGCNC